MKCDLSNDWKFHQENLQNLLVKRSMAKKKTFFKELYIVDCNQIFKGIFLFQMQKDIGSLPDVKSSGH